MADSLVLRGTMRSHTDWVTVIVTPIDNSDMIDTSSRDKLLNHKYDPLLEMRSFKAVKIMSSSYPKTPRYAIQTRGNVYMAFNNKVFQDASMAVPLLLPVLLPMAQISFFLKLQ
ncbi:unnamed protein product [Lactuca saligna]|uniref:Uncharacterized protein n=1 Tax=Lactuca saligna TaxID=75948 RepID=A0AA35YSW6_LACSI|nr:unnamed protein product [Lactuca saligna]